MIILAAAFGRNHELGKEDGEPLWILPDEYQQFRTHILHSPILFGRKSFEVLKKPLAGSLNIVITHQKDYDGCGAVVTHSLKEAIEVAGKAPKIYVVGGGSIFDMAIKVADRLEISRIEGEFPQATAFFPKFSDTDWQLISSRQHPKDERHAYAFLIEVWKRKKNRFKI